MNISKQKLSDRANKAWATRRQHQANLAQNGITAKIKADNTAFHQLPAHEKRIAIAQDVIRSLLAEQVTARTGAWVSPADNSIDRIYQLEIGTQLQPVFQDPAFYCNCCALGACFISAVKLGNDCTVTEEVHAGGEFHVEAGTGMGETLRQYFSFPQLSLMEAAFEQGAGLFSAPDGALLYSTTIPGAFWDEDSELTDNEKEKARGKAERIRLIAIMENVIANRGTFVL